MAGHMFETFVVNEIIKTFMNVGKDYSKYVFYCRGKDKVKRKRLDASGTVHEETEESEIDIIIEEDGVLYPVEIKKRDQSHRKRRRCLRIARQGLEQKKGNRGHRFHGRAQN